MPFIPHTEDDIDAMLTTIGVDTIADLFDEVPAGLKRPKMNQLPSGLSENEMVANMRQIAKDNVITQCFAGAGAYEHAIPAAVWDITSRGEWLTAYTPYQAEASQGGLQVIYEFQSMISALLSMDVANASVYEGASAVVESILMAVRSKKDQARKRVLMLASASPLYRRVVQTVVSGQDITCDIVPFDPQQGVVDPSTLNEYLGDGFDALVIMQPNFFGQLEAVDALTDWAHQHQALAIGVVNPIAMAILKPPGEWGKQGCDIACGEGQSLGVPLSFGGPYLGFMACTKDLLRQMPGRIVGKTHDDQGRPGFVLTLQAREQHIRRGKATSNICTNQGLTVTAATIYMSLLGPGGLRRVAVDCHNKTEQLMALLDEIPGVTRLFPGPFFHEIVLDVDSALNDVIVNMSNKGILPGVSLRPYYPDLDNALLVCVTETKQSEDLQTYAKLLQQSMVQLVGGYV